jgi:hypothetical protein
MDKDVARNKWSFSYYAYKYDSKLKNGPQNILKSTLTNLGDLNYNHSSVKMVDDYASVGEMAFESKLLPNVVQPCVGYPSFKQLNIIDFEFENVNVRKVNFRKMLVKIPQCVEETQPEILEKYLWNLSKQNQKEVFVDLPF